MTEAKPSPAYSGDRVGVVFVQRQNAKTVKQHLVQESLLDARFRMVPASPDATFTLTQQQNNCSLSSWIAIPIVMKENGVETDSTKEERLTSLPWWRDLVEETGFQTCPYSTKVLGNNTRLASQTNASGDSASNNQQSKFSLVQWVLLEGLDRNDHDVSSLFERVRQIDPSICPRNQLEIFGDDRTILLPPTSPQGGDFLVLLRDIWKARHGHDDANHETTIRSDEQIYQDFWRRLAAAHKSDRIVRKGTVDPNSKIRHSGHRLVWPYRGIPETTGPGSPGWIRVTEQGIKQSFDMTRVMFSRGNISEKIRFGELVKEGEVVLDMYAGIGYYTLPAVVHGKASFVYACEWNEHAVTALKHNVVENKISEKVQILAGDCRQVAKENNLVNIADRVSLGLLPSSEGGWRTAIRALKDEKGGWLHIHGNVPVNEKESWVMWVSRQLYNLAQEEKKGNDNDWRVICTHVEKVKSFAPTVFHYVADIWVGPFASFNQRTRNGGELPLSTNAGIVQNDSTFLACPSDIQPPSCALSEDGVLCQEWMR